MQVAVEKAAWPETLSRPILNLAIVLNNTGFTSGRFLRQAYKWTPTMRISNGFSTLNYNHVLYLYIFGKNGGVIALRAVIIFMENQEYMLFNKAPNQFLDCTSLDTKNGLVVSGKFTALAKNKLDNILKTINQVSTHHKEVLKRICSEIVERTSEYSFWTSFPITGQIFRPGQAA